MERSARHTEPCGCLSERRRRASPPRPPSEDQSSRPRDWPSARVLRLLGAGRRRGRIARERSYGRCGSRGRIARRAETSRRRPRWPPERQISDAHDPSRSCLCSSMSMVGGRAIRPGLQDTQPVVPFRGRVARRLVGRLIWPWRDWTRRRAGPRRPRLATVSPGGATAAHRRSDG
jgi:hypothetical protein